MLAVAILSFQLIVAIGALVVMVGMVCLKRKFHGHW